MKKGKVYLIGAGPGDPELFTLKGKRCLEKADVIVGDYLADKRILRFANKNAEYIYVGKSCGSHTMTQQDISRLLECLNKLLLTKLLRKLADVAERCKSQRLLIAKVGVGSWCVLSDSFGVFDAPEARVVVEAPVRNKAGNDIIIVTYKDRNCGII